MSSLTHNAQEAATRRLARARQRARLARLLSGVAAVAAILLIAMFFYQAGLYAWLAPKIVAPTPHVEEPGQITSYDSTLTGKDSGEQPFVIAASKSWQDKDLNYVFHLENMKATLHRANGQPTQLTGNTARYDSHSKTADIDGAVTLAEQGRFTAHMDKARIDMNDRSLRADVPVRVDMTQGTIAANGMQITGDGSTILFLNGVKAHFETPAEPQGASP